MNTNNTLIKTLLLSFLFPAYGHPVSAFEPDFVYPLENVTVAKGKFRRPIKYPGNHEIYQVLPFLPFSKGRDATFTCVVNNLGGYRVSGEATPARVCIRFRREIWYRFFPDFCGTTFCFVSQPLKAHIPSPLSYSKCNDSKSPCQPIRQTMIICHGTVKVKDILAVPIDGVLFVCWREVGWRTSLHYENPATRNDDTLLVGTGGGYSTLATRSSICQLNAKTKKEKKVCPKREKKAQIIESSHQSRAENGTSANNLHQA